MYRILTDCGNILLKVNKFVLDFGLVGFDAGCGLVDFFTLVMVTGAYVK